MGLKTDSVKGTFNESFHVARRCCCCCSHRRRRFLLCYCNRHRHGSTILIDITHPKAVCNTLKKVIRSNINFSNNTTVFPVAARAPVTLLGPLSERS